MNYAVILERTAERQLRNLPQSLRRRIDLLIERLSNNPRPRGAIKLSGRTNEGWRVRVGEYRILYTINDRERVVSIYRIAHRREAYR
ncbi:MAG: type II toxin-antitoxin system RelE/ParE family toxin [Chloroflexi bacterium]|nr:type II toxin-antitoxin system RelE/ParE family toxin [Chloroflexota bacterium]